MQVAVIQGARPVAIPISSIDAFNDESISVCINYAFQTGACLLLLLVVLIMTPPSKLLRSSTLLHLAGLAVCIVRMCLLMAFFLSPFNHFYQFWTGDYSAVPRRHLYASVAGNVVSLVLVVVVEAGLMHQAWTMVSLWPDRVRYSLAAVSASISLLVVAARFAFAVIQSRANLSLAPARNLAWVVHAALVLNALAICWYCALFNVRLVMHLLVNRRILNRRRKVAPMEVLVMTNGVLMLVPVVFAALEWAKIPNFESASLTQTSVVIILPLGTLAAQQMSHGGSLAYLTGSNKSSQKSGSGSGSGSSNAGEKSSRSPMPSLPLSASSPGLSSPHNSALSPPYEPEESPRRKLDHFDLELRQIDCTSELADHGGRVDTDLQHKETRI
ncbi:uncharacterized protein UV8b_04747 [Ustilaginoidea virens]|uniref:Pheromone receptor n=1 Tax=Ustilaginoidea virens TaxID=1159556 RepID=A0A8E5MI05_USTVR|nr:uncharacterized protein UV8b_04747 [Ustilaginoidea virens]QUC20506.1 hypothetical protein UV8b_04747 [Ustilaginoidea virens]